MKLLLTHRDYSFVIVSNFFNLCTCTTKQGYSDSEVIHVICFDTKSKLSVLDLTVIQYFK